MLSHQNLQSWQQSPQQGQFQRDHLSPWLRSKTLHRFRPTRKPATVTLRGCKLPSAKPKRMEREPDHSDRSQSQVSPLEKSQL
jgi:hypothetical protein